MTIKTFLLKQKEFLPFWISLLIITFISYNTFHSDFIVLSKIAEKIAGGNLHIYQDLYICAANYRVPAMPPLIILIDGFFFFLLKELRVLNFDFCLVYHTPSIHLLLLKSRYILTFILSYFMVHKVALLYTKQNKKLARRIANLWIASPILIYLPFAQGNNDIYPVVLSLAFLFFAFRKNFIIAMIFLGLTAAMKSYAVFLVIPVALILSQKNIIKTFFYSSICGLVFFLPRLFYLNDSPSFTKNISESFNVLGTVIPSVGVSYSIFAVGYFLILLFLYYCSDNMKSILEDKNRTLVVYCFLIMSFFYTTWFYPQWFLWILPFFVLLVYKNKKLYSIYLLICSVYFFRTYAEYPGNLDIYLWKRILPLGRGSYYFPGVIPTNSPLLTFGAGLFLSLFIVFIYFLLKDDKKKEEDNKISIYLSYLPTVALFVVIYVFYWLSK